MWFLNCFVYSDYVIFFICSSRLVIFGMMLGCLMMLSLLMSIELMCWRFLRVLWRVWK